METIIPILLTIGFFILQAYLGYKKEQEKAAKRNLNSPNKPFSPSEEPVSQERDWLKELFEPEFPRKEQTKQLERTDAEIKEPAYVQTYVEPRYESTYREEKYVPVEKPVSLLAEYKRLSTYDEDGISKKATQLRKDKRSEIKRLETEALEISNLEWEKSRIHFDLHEAIIIKAILERPYQ